MTRLTRFLIRLYPASWRARYEAEFSELIEELKPTWRTSLDLLKGALTMQLETSSSRKILAAGALLGTLAGVAVWLAAPNTYRSTCMLEIEPPEAAAQWELLIHNRHSLTEIVQNQNLYPAKQNKLPLEEVVAAMDKNIHVQTHAGNKVAVQFDYPDPVLVHTVTDDLISHAIDHELQRRLDSGDTSHGSIRILDTPTRPKAPVSYHVATFALIGLLCGTILAGLFIALMRRRASLA